MNTMGAENTTAAEYCLFGCLPGETHASVLKIDEWPCRIGRRADNSLVLKSDSVSSHHAELMAVPGGVVLRDCDSTNGTYVNRRRVLLEKVISTGDFIQFADVEFQLLEANPQQTPSSAPDETATMTIDAPDARWLLSNFDSLLDADGIRLRFQPLLNLETHRVFAYEAIVSGHMEGLRHPIEIFEAASAIGRVAELNGRIRKLAADSSTFRDRLFLGSHPQESMLRDLLPSLQQLRESAPDRLLVIELQECAVRDIDQAEQFLAGLNDLNIELAFDDLGSGENQLLFLLRQPAEYAKFDQRVTRALTSGPNSQRTLLKNIVSALNDAGSMTVAQGIDNEEMFAACRDVGFALGQGGYFGGDLPAMRPS